jgi:hypothetical protein
VTSQAEQMDQIADELEKRLSSVRVFIAVAKAAIGLGDTAEWAAVVDVLNGYITTMTKSLVRTNDGDRDIGRMQGGIAMAQTLVDLCVNAPKDLERFLAQEDGLQKQLRTLRTGER